MRDLPQFAAGVVDEPTLQLVMIVVTCGGLLSWWGFAAYVHFRRDYFERVAPLSAP